MTKEEILQYIKSELDNNENAEIYLDVDDYKVIVEALEQEFNKDAVKKMFASGLLKDCEMCKVMQVSILDKIRAELADMADSDAYGDYQQGCNFGLMLAAQVIDKYKSESECGDD